jgi:hypothetical protein
MSDGDCAAPARRKFSAAEDEALTRLAAEHGRCNWQQIADAMPGRTARQCRDPFANYLAPSLTQRPWSVDEDWLVIQRYKQIGPHWSRIGEWLPGRSSNVIKNRWYTHLQLKISDYEFAMTNRDAKPRITSPEVFLAMMLNRDPAANRQLA